ncbi:MAG: ankyrin repeat domain-containing protein [Defluviicoccus sp.]
MKATARTARHQGVSTGWGAWLWRAAAAVGVAAVIGTGVADRVPVLGNVLVGGLLVVGPAAAAEESAARATQRLFEAVHSNDLAAARASVAAGADLEATDRWGLTALELAIDKGYYEIAHFLTAARSARRSQRPGTPQPAEAARSALPAPGTAATPGLSDRRYPPRT